MPDSEAAQEPELGQFRIKVRLWLQLSSRSLEGATIKHVIAVNLKFKVVNIRQQMTRLTVVCGGLLRTISLCVPFSVDRRHLYCQYDNAIY